MDFLRLERALNILKTHGLLSCVDSIAVDCGEEAIVTWKRKPSCNAQAQHAPEPPPTLTEAEDVPVAVERREFVRSLLDGLPGCALPEVE